MIQFHHTIRGHLVGNIWMPNAECWKDLAYDITGEDVRFTEPCTLRDHVLRATNDGDFQHCEIAGGFIETVATITKGERVYRRTRLTALDDCRSVADMVRTDWDGPIYDDESDLSD